MSFKSLHNCPSNTEAAKTHTHTHIYLRPYLQGFEDNHRGARGAGGVVVQELLQARLQATEVRGGAEGLGTSVLNGAEGFWEATQFPEALQQQPVDRLRCLTFTRQGGHLQMEAGQQVSQHLVVLLFTSSNACCVLQLVTSRS